MSGAKSASGAARQRRAERRQATYDEMLSLARDALREGRPVSLRAIAAEMGMTAPALYRYVDSHAALQEALSASILDDVLVRVQEAASAWPAQRHGHRLVASLVAFRNWALDRPEEFRLVFGRPRDPQGSSLPMPGQVPIAVSFVCHFVGAVADLHRAGTFAAAPAEQVPERAVASLQRLAEMCSEQGRPIEAPVGLWWRAVTYWVMLCGVVRMEVDGVPGTALVADGAMFWEAVGVCGEAAGVPAESLANARADIAAAA